MRDRIQLVSQDDHLDGSSNFLNLIQKLEASSVKWIDDTNEVLDK